MCVACYFPSKGNVAFGTVLWDRQDAAVQKKRAETIKTVRKFCVELL